MQKNQIFIVSAILIIAVGAVSFFGGYKYGQSKSTSNSQGFSTQRQFGQGQFGQENRTGANGANAARRTNGGGFVNGQVIAKDDKSITIKSQDGGSKIVFLSGSTQISKSASGTISDLSNNTNVLVNGTTNTDGSITATFIQIRPQGEAGLRPQNRDSQPGQIPGQGANGQLQQ
jgi:hypothetical protein